MRLELDGEEVGAGESWQDNEGSATCTDSGYEGDERAYGRKRSKYREKMRLLDNTDWPINIHWLVVIIAKKYVKKEVLPIRIASVRKTHFL